MHTITPKCCLLKSLHSTHLLSMHRPSLLSYHKFPAGRAAAVAAELNWLWEVQKWGAPAVPCPWVQGKRHGVRYIDFCQLRQWRHPSSCSLPFFSWAKQREALSPFPSLPSRWHDPCNPWIYPCFLPSWEWHSSFNWSSPMHPELRCSHSTSYWFSKSSQQYRLISPCSSSCICFRTGVNLSPGTAFCNSPLSSQPQSLLQLGSSSG